ncbi:MAG: SoxR reducing system RseC family protein [Desulfobacter sp.]|nr:MAG: SoxR reducing system RseC family protein [Desulfobacter sp.]
MITENGIVTRIDKDMAWIKTTRSAACESCSQKDSCGTSHHGAKEMVVSVKNTLGVTAGDAVVIGMESRPMMVLSFLLYVFPIILLIIGAAIGDFMAPMFDMNKSLLAMGMGFSFFALAFIIIRKKQSAFSDKAEYKPFLVRKRPSSDTGDCQIS